MVRRSLLLVFLLSACAPRRDSGEIHVAAAANLQRVFEPLAKAFEKRAGQRLVPSFGASTQLAQQIENGGPFEVFLSADTAQVDRLAAKGLVVEGTRGLYARGALVLWAPKRTDIHAISDLAGEGVKKIGIANPELAPYGKAAIETLTALRLWPALQPKVVYGPNILVVAQFADSANADAAFTASALVIERPGNRVPVPENLHRPIEQALCIVKGAAHLETARQFREFLLGREAQGILAKFGYLPPGA